MAVSPENDLLRAKDVYRGRAADERACQFGLFDVGYLVVRKQRIACACANQIREIERVAAKNEIPLSAGHIV